MDATLGIFRFPPICSLDTGVNVEVLSSKAHANIRCEIFTKVIHNVNVLNDIVRHANHERTSAEASHLVAAGHNQNLELLGGRDLKGGL